MDTPPRSPPEPPPDEELLEMVGVTPVPTQLKERPEMTAKQRWHWAYNQIIMQLNVRNPLATRSDKVDRSRAIRRNCNDGANSLASDFSRSPRPRY